MPRHKGPQLPEPWGELTLKALAARAAMTAPARVFLRDCPDREAWNGMEPRSLTFDAFNKAAHFLAAQIRTLGVRPGEHVLILLPNMVETQISLLACHLAGAIPAIAAVDERAEVLRAAAERCGAVLIITTGRVGDLPLSEKARQVAAKALCVRGIAGFGLGLPEGIASLEGWSEEDVVELHESDRHQSQHGLITFAREGGGLSAFLRTEGQMVAEALALSSVLRLDGRRGLISLMHPAAAASVAANLILPLHAGASVRLVGPYEGKTLAAVLDADPTAFLFGPDHFMAQLTPGSFGESRLGNVAGLLALARAQGPEAHLMPAGAMDVALVVDFFERGLMTCLTWPKDGRLALPNPYPHPMESVLPEGAVMLAHGAGANGPAFSGFGAATPTPRAEAGKAA
jgi:AMP-binding enzyme